MKKKVLHLLDEGSRLFVFASGVSYLMTNLGDASWASSCQLWKVLDLKYNSQRRKRNHRQMEEEG